MFDELNWPFNFIKPRTPFSAPVGCLQFYTGASGTLKSFNYMPDVNAANNPNHLANQNYAMCIRVENGYCGISYSQVSTDLYSFTVSGDASPSESTTDWVMQLR